MSDIPQGTYRAEVSHATWFLVLPFLSLPFQSPAELAGLGEVVFCSLRKKHAISETLKVSTVLKGGAEKRRKILVLEIYSSEATLFQDYCLSISISNNSTLGTQIQCF